MTLSFTPINELTFADTLASGDYLLVWDISAANLAKRLTLQALAEFLSLIASEIAWEGVTGKPIAFPPSTHIHIPADISGFDSAVDVRLGNLPNGAIIGGVAHFCQSSAPVTRIGGSPLQIGDRWYNPNTGIAGVWFGTFWLGPSAYADFFNAGSPLVSNRSTEGNAVFAPNSIKESVVIVGLALWGFVTTANNSSNRWNVKVATVNPGGSSFLSVASFDTQIWGVSGTQAYGFLPVNEFVPGLPIQSFALAVSKIGSPGNLTLSAASIEYRRVL